MIRRFFKWLFKSDWDSDLPSSPWDNTDYLNCDKTEAEYMADQEVSYISESAALAMSDSVARIEEDAIFHDVVDPKGCRVEIYKDRKKEWRWRMFSANHRIIAVSGEGYKRRGAMRKSLDLVREVIPFVPVEEK